MVKKVVFWILVIFCMTAIFAFSAQRADASDELSLGVTERLIEFIRLVKTLPVFSNVDAEKLASYVQYANHIVRKLAHFSIFACLGISVYNLMVAYGIKRIRVVLYASAVCLLYAVSDEVHQLFVPGRACQLKDIIIDFCGSFSAIGTAYLLFGRRFDNHCKEGRG